MLKRTATSNTTSWNVTDAELAEDIDNLSHRIAVLEKAKGHMEQELTRRLQERGAQELAHPTLEVKLVRGTPQYDLLTMMLLKELIDPEEWNKAYSPEHEETITVKAKLNMVKARHWPTRFGNDVAQVFEKALIATPSRLSIVAKT